MRRRPVSTEVDIGKFISSVLILDGYKRGTDFEVRGDILTLTRTTNRKRILEFLKDFYPQHSYYWLTPKKLTWF